MRAAACQVARKKKKKQVWICPDIATPAPGGSPVRQLMVVVLPAPLGPSRQKRRPFSIANQLPLTAQKSRLRALPHLGMQLQAGRGGSCVCALPHIWRRSCRQGQGDGEPHGVQQLMACRRTSPGLLAVVKPVIVPGSMDKAQAFALWDLRWRCCIELGTADMCPLAVQPQRAQARGQLLTTGCCCGPGTPSAARTPPPHWRCRPAAPARCWSLQGGRPGRRVEWKSARARGGTMVERRQWSWRRQRNQNGVTGGQR